MGTEVQLNYVLTQQALRTRCWSANKFLFLHITVPCKVQYNNNNDDDVDNDDDNNNKCSVIINAYCSATSMALKAEFLLASVYT